MCVCVRLFVLFFLSFLLVCAFQYEPLNVYTGDVKPTTIQNPRSSLFPLISNIVISLYGCMTIFLKFAIFSFGFCSVVHHQASTAEKQNIISSQTHPEPHLPYKNTQYHGSFILIPLSYVFMKPR